MDRYQHRKMVQRLIQMDRKCIVCGGDITPGDIQWDEDGKLKNCITPKIDTREGWKLSNMNLKHRSCSISKMEEQLGEDYELLINIIHRDGGCYNCGYQFKLGDNIDDFKLVNHGKNQSMAHKVCPITENDGDTTQSE